MMLKETCNLFDLSFSFIHRFNGGDAQAQRERTEVQVVGIILLWWHDYIFFKLIFLYLLVSLFICLLFF